MHSTKLLIKWSYIFLPMQWWNWVLLWNCVPTPECMCSCFRCWVRYTLVLIAIFACGFVNLTSSSGTEIWRIENFQPVPLPKSDYGKFYTGDSYIVLQVRVVFNFLFCVRTTILVHSSTRAFKFQLTWRWCLIPGFWKLLGLNYND